MKLRHILLLSIILLAGCNTIDPRQHGGRIGFQTQHSDVVVEQPENAEEPAALDFDEDNVLIRYNTGDVFKMDIVTEPSGKTIKSIDFQPQSPNELVVSNTSAAIQTGSSYEDMVGQLNVFLKNAKMILWVGIGFLAAGGLFIGILRDVKTGVVLLGIGVMMLGGYALLPQIYSNWLLVLCGGVVIVPIIWWLTHRQHSRISKASVSAYEKIKIKYPDIAKEMANEFKAVLPPKDIVKAKKLK